MPCLLQTIASMPASTPPPPQRFYLPPPSQGPYQAGADASFRGKVSYRHCRQPVWPPSDWDGSLAARSARLPRAGLALEHVYG